MKKNALFLVIISLSGLLACHFVEDSHSPPNIVFILVDDLGYSDVGYMGYKQNLHTPNIDKLAASGKVFTHAYAAAPVCSPTRGSILTGKSPATLQLTCHIPGLPMDQYLERQHKDRSMEEAYFMDHLPTDELTFVDKLQDGGYATGFFGKWHLAGAGSARSNTEGIINAQYHPEHQGFDINIGGCAYGQPKSWFAPYQNATIIDFKEGEYLTNRMGEEAVNFIKQNSTNPFLLYLSTYTVHTPLRAPEDVIEQNGGNVYHAMIEMLDRNIGKVMDELEESNLLSNTLIIFYSDNGGLWGNAPLRGKKGSLHEGGIRVPLVMSWPDHIESGKSKTPVTSIDLFPTLLDAAGVSYEDYDQLEGVSLYPLLLEQKEPEARSLYWHFPHFRKEGLDMGAVIRDGDWKLIWDLEADTTFLYNLKEDLGEANDLAAEHAEKAEVMLTNLKTWQKLTNAQMPKNIAESIIQ